MHSLFNVAAAAATLLLPTAFAAPEPGTLRLDFQKHTVPASRSDLERRQNAKTVNAPITNYQTSLYLINVTVGTPPQKISLQLDTGSSDIWFPSANASYCRTHGPCLGTYDASASSTYRDPGYGQFEIGYVDGTQVDGVYISDTLTVGGTTLNNLVMADAFQTGQGTNGIMGIGFSSDEAASPDLTYPNIIDELVLQGKINTRSYSLWLDDLNANTGSILFGGVDKSKYVGDLLTVPLQRSADSGNYTSPTIAMTGLTVVGGGQTSNLSPSSPIAAILDSGTTLLYLPDDVCSNVWNGVGVVTDRELGAVIPCDLANDDLTFIFQFGGSNGPKINISISEFVLTIFPNVKKQPTFSHGPYKGRTVCQFGILPAGDNILFGDTFLRSAYVVYDLQNRLIGLAQTNFNSNSDASNVEAFSSGSIMPDAVSTVTGVTVAAASETALPTQASASGTGDIGDQATTRTPTFSLVRGTGTGTATSSSSGAATPVNIPSIERSTITVFCVTVVAFFFGAVVL